MKNFCYLEPEFPKEAVLLSLFILEEQPLSIITLQGLFDSPVAAGEEAQNQIAHLHTLAVEIPEDCMLTSIQFEKLVPLKEAYWQAPSISLDIWKRNQSFAKMAVNPMLYQVLVVATFIDESEQELAAVLPMLNADEKTIENFMMMSDQVVDQKAKYAALYTVQKVMRFNWQTYEISEAAVQRSKNSNWV